MANIFDHIQDHSRLGLDNKFLENKSRRIFLRSPGLLYKFLPTNLRVFKPTFYNFYTSHVRWNSTIYHTDLGQNAVFGIKIWHLPSLPHIYSSFFFLQRHICKEKICANPFWVCGIFKVIYSSQAFMVSSKGYSLMLRLRPIDISFMY